MKNEVIKIKVNQTSLPNKLHFEIQKNTRAIVYRNRKKYTRKTKYKNERNTQDE